ncbi:class F sortase [Nocardioides euryhalodurans]|nr:class F sortase [Nocardioides euryhalodurans]
MESGEWMRRAVVRSWSTVVGVALVLAVSACQEEPAPSPLRTELTPAPPEVQEVVPGVGVQQRLERARPSPVLPAEAGAPLRVGVPSLGVDVPVVPITAPGGVLTPPADPQVLGWWSDGAAPGAATGSALVTGHTVSTGGGALDDLEQLQAGDRVWVDSPGGRIPYAVRTTEVLGKGELAERAEELFDQGVPGRLVLITCEDWNGSVYLSNVVTTASPVVRPGRMAS